MNDLWERRIRRAEQLEKEWPYAAEILRFYRGFSTLQKQCFEKGKSSDDIRGAILDLVERDGPEILRPSAKSLRPHPDVLRKYSEQGREGDNPAADLILKCFSQIAVTHAKSGNRRVEEPQQHCPQCGFPPLVSVHREDPVGETVRRSLVCPFCPEEWEFPRVLCPECKEERPEKLPRYQAPEISWVRIEACDTCMRYLKSVDLTKNPDAEPVVDELASTPLDVIAHEKGYQKIVPNLAGI